MNGLTRFPLSPSTMGKTNDEMGKTNDRIALQWNISRIRKRITVEHGIKHDSPSISQFYFDSKRNFAQFCFLFVLFCFGVFPFLPFDAIRKDRKTNKKVSARQHTVHLNRFLLLSVADFSSEKTSIDVKLVWIEPGLETRSKRLADTQSSDVTTSTIDDGPGAS